MNNDNDLFPELNGIREKEKKERNKSKLDFEPNDDTKIPEEEKIKTDVVKKKKKRKKEKIEHDPIMNPKKPRRKRDFSLVFLVLLIILIIVTAFFGIKYDILNVTSIKNYFKDQEYICTKVEDFDTYTVETKHIFKYRFNYINQITSNYIYQSEHLDILDEISVLNNKIIANAAGYRGISYFTEISINEYSVYATYDLYKIDIKTVIEKNNNNKYNKDEGSNRLTFIDISQRMHIKSIIYDYNESGFTCVK